MNADIQELVNKIKNELKTDPTLGRERLAKILGETEGKIRTALKYVKTPEFKKETEKGQEIKKDFKINTGEITTRSMNITTLDDALNAANVDLDVWEVERHVVNSWEVTMGADKTCTGFPETYTNFQVKVWLRRIHKEFDPETLKKELFREVKKQARPVKKFAYSKSKEKNNLLMMSMNDIHLGRYSWEEEVERDYDHIIASKNFNLGFHGLINQSQGFKFEEILYIVGNDLFNYDSIFPYPMTERGTPQKSDTRWQKLFRLGRTLIVDSINTLSTIAPVKVLVIPGNHDAQTIFHLGEVLEVIYDKNKNVTIDNRPKRRKYHRYGGNLIGAAHGHWGEKLQDLFAVMVAEAPEMISDTKYRYFYMGHKHHETTVKSTVKEKYNGVRTLYDISEDYKGLLVDYLPNLAFRDDYEYKECFVGTIRSAKCAVHHKERGRIATFNYNL